VKKARAILTPFHPPGGTLSKQRGEKERENAVWSAGQLKTQYQLPIPEKKRERPGKEGSLNFMKADV